MSALRLSRELAAWARLAAELVNTRRRSTDRSEKLVGPAELERLLADCPERPPATSSPRCPCAAPTAAQPSASYCLAVGPDAYINGELRGMGFGGRWRFAERRGASTPVTAVKSRADPR